MGHVIRHLVTAFAILVCSASGPMSQTPEVSQPPRADGGGDGAAQLPGTLVWPPLTRSEPRDAQSGERSREATPDNDANGGCRYVPRKLDLIV